MPGIFVKSMFDGVSIGSSASANSTHIDLGNLPDDINYVVDGYFSLETRVVCTATGDVDITVQIANTTDLNFRAATGSTAIAEELFSTGGGSSDGRTIFQFSPDFGRFFRLQATNGSSAAVTFTGVLAVK